MDSWSQVAKLETKLTEKLSRPKEELVARTSTTQSEISMSPKLSSETAPQSPKASISSQEEVLEKKSAKKSKKKSKTVVDTKSSPETTEVSPKASSDELTSKSATGLKATKKRQQNK